MQPRRKDRHLVVVGDRPWAPSTDAAAMTVRGPTQAEREQLWARIERALDDEADPTLDAEERPSGEHRSRE